MRKGLVIRMSRHLLYSTCFLLATVFNTQPSKSEDMGKVVVSIADKIQKGNIALIDTKNSRIIELGVNGNVVWQTKLPDLFEDGAWNAGADIEWLPNTDTFLVAVPMSGFFEIARDGKIITQCKTKFISHDVDKIDGGRFVFVNGWDDKGKNEPIITLMSSKCDIIWEKKTEFFGVNEEDLQPRFIKDRAKLHTNSVRLLPNGNYMASIRNYDQIVIFDKTGVTKRFKDAPGVHDPSAIYKEDDGEFFYYANRGRLQSINKRDFNFPERGPKIIWSGPPSPKRSWKPLRTLEKLANGNWLVTGSREVGQVSEDGELVWELHFPEFRHQKQRGLNKTYIYKASFVYPSDN